MTSDEIATVRFLLGGISSSLVSDADMAIAYGLAAGDLFETAALCADGLAGKYSSSVTFSVEGLSIQNAQKVENWRRLASSLRARGENGSGSIGTPSVFGISLGDMEAVE